MSTIKAFQRLALAPASFPGSKPISVQRSVGVIIFAGLLSCAVAQSADWITARGDAQRTGAQLNETALSRSSVSKLRLLWSKNLDRANRLPADPLIFGPFITHRGIKELVIEQDSADTVWAIDADLGTTFWKRSFIAGSAVFSPAAPCSRQQVAPAMSVPPFPIKLKNPNSDDNFSDGNRPIFAFANDRILYSLRPSTGQDFYPPRQVLPSNAHPVEIEVIDGAISFLTTPNCESGDPTQTWTLPLNEPKAQALPGASSPSMPENGDGQASFVLDSYRVTARLTPAGELLLVNESNRLLLFRSKPLDASAPLGLATAENQDGRRFLFVAFAARLAAFTLSPAPHDIDAHMSWSTDQVHPLGAPVAANGLVYVLTSKQDSTLTNLQLCAFDSDSGANLYTSAALSDQTRKITNLALANGHVVFATASALYCFGFPVDL